MRQEMNPYQPPEKAGEKPPDVPLPENVRKGLRSLIVSVILLPATGYTYYNTFLVPRTILVLILLSWAVMLVSVFVLVRKRQVWARNLLVVATVPLCLFYFIAFRTLLAAFPVQTIVTSLLLFFQALACFALMRRDVSRWFRG